MSSQSTAETTMRRQRRRRNRYVFASLAVLVLAMNGFAYATVPAYRAFCQKFGFKKLSTRSVIPGSSSPADSGVSGRSPSSWYDSSAFRYSYRAMAGSELGETSKF